MIQIYSVVWPAEHPFADQEREGVAFCVKRSKNKTKSNCYNFVY